MEKKKFKHHVTELEERLEFAGWGGGGDDCDDEIICGGVSPEVGGGDGNPINIEPDNEN